MKFYFKLLEKVKNQAGVTAVIVAIVSTALIGFTSLAVDVGYMYVTKNELQNVADAAALAATRKLGTIYQGMTYDEQLAYICGGGGNDDITVIKGIANAVAQNNKAGGKQISVHAEGINEVEIGDWDPSDTPPSFTETNDQPDAVRVRAHRDGVANGPITTFFAKIFGVDAVDISADATAALTGQTTTKPGEIELPLGISTVAASPDRCDKDIIFSPTKVSCAGWNTFSDLKTSDIKVRNILDDMEDGTIESPASTSGEDIFGFIGGKLSDPTFYEFILLFKDKGYDVKVVGLDVDGNEILEPVATDADGNPITGHLNPADHPEVVPLLDSDGNPRLYPDGGFDAKGDHIFSTPRNKHLWPTMVVVYKEPGDGPDCENPTGSLLIVGYANILLTDIICQTNEEGVLNKSIEGKLECEHVSNADTRGGGGEYGTKGSIPCLVE